MSPKVPVAQSQRVLLIAVPTVEGNVDKEFPVVQFQHGFWMENTYYGQIISHIASYGFIVVAPQVNSLASFGLQKSSSKIMFHFPSRIFTLNTCTTFQIFHEQTPGILGLKMRLSSRNRRKDERQLHQSCLFGRCATWCHVSLGSNYGQPSSA